MKTILCIFYGLFCQPGKHAFIACLNAWKTKATVDPEFYFKFKPIGLNHKQGGNRMDLD